MITIEKFVFNPFQENTYLLYDETKQAVIIDPGCFAEKEKNLLNKYISQNDLTPVHLLNTHGHIDHILGNDYVSKTYNLPIKAHKADEFLVKNAVNHAFAFGMEIKEIPGIDIFIGEEEKISFGNSELEIIHIPGHSPGGIVFYNRKQAFMVVGDVLFEDSIGRSDLPGGDFNLLINSIKHKLFPLGDDIKVYPGHGPSTTIGRERVYNPFLS